MPVHSQGTAWAVSPAPDDRHRAALILYAPVALSLLVQVPATIAIAIWSRSPAWAGVLAAVLATASALALLAARRLPGPVVATVSALALASLFVPPGFGPPFLSLLFAIVGAVVRGARQWALASVGTAWVAALVLGALAGLQWHPFRIAGTTVVLLICFGVGEAVRSRLERAAVFRARASARRAGIEQAERTRIARELHDVLAHSLSQISVQSGVALHLFDRDPEKAREALAHIRALSGAGLDEVRGVLGFLRGDEPAPVSPEPQLSELAALAASRSGLGLLVDVEVPDLDPEPASAVQATAYRIAQEALTNVVRHSGATHALVAVERRHGALRVVVEDDGVGFAAAGPAGGGMRGMRERVALAGGTLETGASEKGGARLVATLPEEQA